MSIPKLDHNGYCYKGYCQMKLLVAFLLLLVMFGFVGE